MMQRILAITVLLLGWTIVSAADVELFVGDPAPPLALKEFIKGQPVRSLEKGTIYVVEFTKLQCPPCHEAIPHLTQLQKKYKDVIFISVFTVAEPKPEEIKPFIAKLGDKLDFRVALDDTAVGERKGPGGKWWVGKMEKTWLRAADPQIPTPQTFIVNGDGKVAWIGHPMALDKPLEKITSGQWDLAAATKEYKDAWVTKHKRRELWGKVAGSLRGKSGDPNKALAIIEQAIADDPKSERMLRQLKLEALIKQADGTDKALHYGKRLLETIDQKDALALDHFAENVLFAFLGNPKPDAQLIQLALQAALQADQLAPGMGDDVVASRIANTLAHAYFLSGDIVKAVETQEQAVKLAGEGPGAKYLKKRLEEYKKAAEKKKTLPRPSV